MARTEQAGKKITPARAKRAIGVARVVGPVVAPYAMRAAGAARDAYDRMRAHRLGVEVDSLPRFTGKGAALHARIAGIDRVLGEVRHEEAEDRHAERPTTGGGQEASGKGDAGEGDVEVVAGESDLTGETESRLAKLASAVRAAERMPAARRKATHRAVSAELDHIEQRLLHRLGVHTGKR